MSNTGASGGTYRGQILLAMAVMQKNAIPALMQAVRGMLRQLAVAYKYATRLASAALANSRLRKVATAQARRLLSVVAALASHAAKWRRLVEFLATQVFKKTTAAPTTPETEQEAAPAPVEPTAAAPETEAEEEEQEEAMPAKTDPQLAALARYSSLDDVSRKTRSRATKKKRSGSSDKIAALRRKK
jgi:hypothetical protein